MQERDTSFLQSVGGGCFDNASNNLPVVSNYTANNQSYLVNNADITKEELKQDKEPESWVAEDTNMYTLGPKTPNKMRKGPKEPLKPAKEVAQSMDNLTLRASKKTILIEQPIAVESPQPQPAPKQTQNKTPISPLRIEVADE